MAGENEVQRIIAQYEKFGWQLRYAVAQPEFIDLVRDNLPESVAIRPHIIVNGLWFSRESYDGVAWEIRKLGGSPFALVVVLPNEVETAEFEARLQALENELAQRFDVSKK